MQKDTMPLSQRFVSYKQEWRGKGGRIKAQEIGLESWKIYGMYPQFFKNIQAENIQMFNVVTIAGC